MANVKLAAPAASDGPRGPNQYRRGADFERRTAAALEADGYVLLRAAGSKGKADLVALKPGEVVLVQCKLVGPSAVRPPEWNALYALALRAGALAVIAYRPRRGRIEYARITGLKTSAAASRRGLPVLPWRPDRVIEGEL